MKYKKKGFTLVELLVTIAIIGIMATVVLAFTMRNKVQEEVNVAADELASRINDMKHRALGGDAGNGNTACGFGVHFSTAASYQTYYAEKGSQICSSAVPYATDETTPTLSTWNNSRITIGGGSNTNIYFSVPFGEKTLSTIPDSTDISVGMTGQVTRHVCITASGTASVQDTCP